MKRFWKILKRTLQVVLGVMVLLVVSVIVFVNVAPQIGQAPEGEDLERIRKSPHYEEDGFVNLIETHQADFWKAMKTMPDMFFQANLTPTESLPVKYDEGNSGAVDTLTYVTWYGHSAFLIEMDGLKVLIDPMLGDFAAPVSLGANRYQNDQEVPLEDIEEIDILILSHDHYDHLDYATILALRHKVEHYYTALGVGSHLKSWGIDAAKITELDWWESADEGSIKIIAAPSRHFSGRGLTDNCATQWASWIIRGEHQNLYFSGDGGYAEHFVEIGEKYGPFDFAMMECGQYNAAWPDIHMMPEMSVQAGIDVKADLIMPIHWGAFTLGVHEWTEPVNRFTAEAQKLDVPVVHPYIGERFAIGQDFPRERWWE
ncbi:MAG: MBL fold metallo-hydrolase [Flavobacteriia bacterium]|nr:MBL fold metallo-hydrolase [Flavobacteriia bacterium]